MLTDLIQLASILAFGKSLLVLALVLPPSGQELPAGTKLNVRLKSKVASDSSKKDDPVEAVVLIPVVAQNQVLVPAGTIVKGKVIEAHSVDQINPRAMLKLEFDSLVNQKGKTTKIAAGVVEVDNARETVDETGKIVGIVPSETLSARMDQGLEKLSSRLGGLASVLQSAKKSLVQESNPEIQYPPGVEMELALAKAVSVEGSEALGALPVKAIQDEEKLTALVNEQPFQTMADKPPRPSDITNLMFLGSREAVESAFKAAGWAPAAELSSKTQMETARAIIESRGYSEAPVSLLLLAGQKPDLVFQKQNNTFAKRHHLRIWRLPGGFLDCDIWVSSATHDIGIEFSPENKTFIHKIDSNIDAERAKVVTDLLFTGKVEGLSLVDRPSVPTEGKNATGDSLLTDGKLAVLLLSASNAP